MELEFALGRAYRAENDGVPNENAIRAYETAVTLDPSDAQAHVVLASWYFKQKRWGNAYHQWKLAAALGHTKASELIPGAIDMLIDEMGPLFLKAMKSPDAIEEFMEFVNDNILAIDATAYARIALYCYDQHCGYGNAPNIDGVV